jgi:hypothetical protein
MGVQCNMSSKVQYNVACFVRYNSSTRSIFGLSTFDRIFQQGKRENAEETGSLEDNSQDTVLRTCL